MLPIYSGKMINTPKTMLLKKIDSPYSRGQQLSNSSSVSYGGPEPPLSQLRSLLALSLGGTVQAAPGCWEFTSMAVLPCPGDTMLLQSLMVSDSSIFPPTFRVVAKPWKQLRHRYFICAKYSTAIYSVYFGQLSACTLATIHCTKKLLQ